MPHHLKKPISSPAARKHVTPPARKPATPAVRKPATSVTPTARKPVHSHSPIKLKKPLYHTPIGAHAKPAAPKAVSKSQGVAKPHPKVHPKPYSVVRTSQGKLPAGTSKEEARKAARSEYAGHCGDDNGFLFD